MASTTGTLDKFFYTEFLQDLSNKELTFSCTILSKRTYVILEVLLDGKDVNLV